MIGRAAYGRPWIVKQMIDYLRTGIVTAAPAPNDIVILLQQHYDAIIAHYGPHLGVGIARKHIGWYCKMMPGSEEFREAINQMTNPQDVKLALDAYFLKMAA
jgi:tRNA-dihydrouridine synthase B